MHPMWGPVDSFLLLYIASLFFCGIGVWSLYLTFFFIKDDKRYTIRADSISSGTAVISCRTTPKQKLSDVAKPPPMPRPSLV